MESKSSIVQELARDFIRTSDNIDKPESIFGDNNPDSPLNPQNKKFDTRAWATNFANVANESGEDFHRVGFCFQNLNVFGYGTPIDFQKNVVNIWLALPGMVQRLFSTTPGHSRIDILRQFDGFIRSDEMCVVLGLPDSSCSTLLKTLQEKRMVSLSMATLT